MHKLLLLLLLMILPNAAFALEQNFTQQGVKTTVKLSPERLEKQSKVQLVVGLSKDGAPLTDRDVTLEVYEQKIDQPVIMHQVDVLDDEYVDSWTFEKAGDYRVVVKIADHQKPDEIIEYEVTANVMDAGSQYVEHGFISHHFGDGHWGWWGAGIMLIMMPMMFLL